MWNGKGWAGSKLAERQTERDIPLLRKGCDMVNKLDHWSSYIRGLEKGKSRALSRW
jgi:hypothetical protein